jgi:pimeloyl-ACP methyl ester carboxylesterase
MDSACWKGLISYLVDSGYPRLYLHAIDLRPANGSNIEAAESQIAPKIEEFLARINTFIRRKYPEMAPKEKVDFISHSMGGLSSRWYAAKIRPDRVRIWISLAGANHGSNTACSRSDPGAQDLCPAYAKSEGESLVQYVLNGAPRTPDIDETPYGIGLDSRGVDSVPSGRNRRILYVTLRTRDDEWIDPDDSVILDGAGGVEINIPKDIAAEVASPGNMLVKYELGHDEMLEDRDTHRLVEILLETPTTLEVFGPN